MLYTTKIGELCNHVSSHFPVWIYPSSRKLSDVEALCIIEQFGTFQKNWNTHGTLLVSHVHVLFNYFMVVIVDTNVIAPSGCAIDASVRCVKEICKQMQVDFFQRHMIHVLKNEMSSIEQIDMLQLNETNIDMLFFNHASIQRVEQLQREWLIPIKRSWLERNIATLIG